MKETPTYRKMTEIEKLAAILLSECSFPPATRQKRFALNIGGLAKMENPEITEKQANYLWLMLHRYRRQLRPTQEMQKMIGEKVREAEKIKRERMLEKQRLTLQRMGF